MAKNTSVLQVKKLTKTFTPGFTLPWAEKSAPFTAVNSISFEMGKGEILGLLGPNGAGKTTTIQMLLSVLSPTSGEVTFFGKSLFTHRSEILKDVAFASTYVKLPWRLTVYENLDVYGRLYGVSRADRLKRIERFLKFFGVWEKRNKEMSGLSAGQTTRVMLAKAFIAYPKVALLDEPTASLDPDIAHEVRTFVKEQRQEYGVSILYTSHNMDEVSDVCDRVMFLQNGKIVADDTPSNLAKRVSTSYVHLTVGDGLKRTVEYAQKHKLEHKIIGRVIVITIDEHAISSLLSSLASVGVRYTSIRIDTPTLEDYFLQVAGRGKTV